MPLHLSINIIVNYTNCHLRVPAANRNAPFLNVPLYAVLNPWPVITYIMRAPPSRRRGRRGLRIILGRRIVDRQSVASINQIIKE